MIALFAVVALAFPVRAEPLSLEAAARLAVERSPEVQTARAHAAAAALEEPLLLSNTDPSFESSYAFTDDQAPRASPAFQGSRSRVENWQAGFRQHTLLGTDARLRFSNERTVNPSAFRVLDPTVDSRLKLELSQPLLRYFWGRPDIARRKRARASTAAAQARLRQALEGAAAAAARAFLELHYARERARIQEGGVEDARRLLAKTEEKRRYGLAEDADVLQATAALEAQTLELLLARSAVDRAGNALVAALRADTVPAELAVSTGSGSPPDIAEADAVGRRADVEAARRRAENLEWAARVTKLDTLPELSFNVSYGVAGLDTGYRRSWSDLGSLDHSVKTAGVGLAVPLGFRKERLERKQAGLAFEAAAAEKLSVETQALRELRDAEEYLRLSRLRSAAAAKLVEIERRKYEAEEKLFKRGRSSTDLLLRFQQDIRRSQTELLRASTDETLAGIELARARGVLSERLGL